MKSFKKFIEFKSADQKPKYYELYMQKMNDDFIMLERSRMKYRRIVLLLSIINLAILVVSLQYDTRWVKKKEDKTVWSGLWELCFLSTNYSLFLSHTNTEQPFLIDHASSLCHIKIEYLQKSVIGSLILATGLGLIGSILAMAGFITGNLFKKYYYFHSAGEFFLVAAFAILLAVIVYPVTILHYLSRHEGFSLGYGYMLCWVAFGFYMISFFVMLIDEFCVAKKVDKSNVSACSSNARSSTISKQKIVNNQCQSKISTQSSRKSSSNWV